MIMQIIEILDRYIEVCDFLNDKANKHLLLSFKESVMRKDYLLPFIGQFSAGKSRLINNLLRRNLLPTKRVETTAFLTFIKYGEKEKAIIEYQDGTSEAKEIDVVKTLDQEANAAMSNPITRLTIFIKSDLLKTGLTIVDTPGVNTLIQSHIEMTESLLDESQYIVYVLGKAPDCPDIVMAQKIEQLNIPVIFVRTHLDCVNLDEESYNKVESEEKKAICDELEHDVRFFALSNELDFNVDSKWNNRYMQFYTFLHNDFISAVETIYTNALLNRIEVVKQIFVKAINNKEQVLSKNSDKTIEELQQQQYDLERTVTKLNEDLRKIKHKWQSSTACIEQNIDGCISKESHAASNLFKKKLDNLSSDSDTKQAVNNLYNTELSNSIARLNQTVEKMLMDSLIACDKELKINVDTISVDLQQCGINLDCSFDLREATEYDIKMEKLRIDTEEKITQMQTLTELADSELQELGLQRKDISNVLNQMQQANSELSQVVADFNANSEPKYVHKQSSLGNALSKLGSLCDIAMLLVPATGWTKASEMLAAKGLALAGKSGKMAQLGSKLLTSASKGVKFIAATDATKDTANLIGGTIDTVVGKSSLISQYGGDAAKLMGEIREQKTIIEASRNNGANSQEAKKTSLFDCLSLSYWFGVLGEMIDPSTDEVDMDYALQCERTRQELQRQADIAMKEKLEMMRRIGTIKDAESERKAIIKNQEIQKKNIDREYNKEVVFLNKEKNDRILKIVFSQAEEKFTTNINMYAKALTQRSKEELEKAISGILKSATVKFNSDLTQVQDELNHIIKTKQSESSNSVDMKTILTEMRKRLSYE